jgi:hypothetical protein
MDYIKEIQKALEVFSNGAELLNEAIDKCEDIGFRFILNDYLMIYAKVNYEFSTYLIMKLTEAYTKDRDDAEFKRIIKQLEDKDGNK